MNELFCIHCQRMAHLEEGIVFGHLVYIPVFDFDEPMGVDVDLCEFPDGFAYCPPPLEPAGDWQDALIEPGEDMIEPEFSEDIRAEQAYRKCLENEAMQKAYLEEV